MGKFPPFRPRSKSINSRVLTATKGLLSQVSTFGLSSPVTFSKAGGHANLSISGSGAISAAAAIDALTTQTLSGTATGADGCVIPFALNLTADTFNPPTGKAPLTLDRKVPNSTMTLLAGAAANAAGYRLGTDANLSLAGVTISAAAAIAAGVSQIAIVQEQSSSTMIYPVFLVGNRPDIRTPPAITGTTYYVSPTGSDAAAGTSPATAWQTLARVQTAFASLNAGDAILFEGGKTFTGSTGLNPGTKSGTQTNRITLGTYGTGRAKLLITDPAVNSCALLLYNAQGWSIWGIDFDGGGVTGYGVVVEIDTGTATTASYYDFIDLNITGFLNSGLLLGSDVTGKQIREVIMSGVRSSNGKDGLYVYGQNVAYGGARDIVNVTIENCQFDNNPGDMGAWFNSMSNVAVSWTSFSGNGALSPDNGRGVFVGGCDNVTFTYCVTSGNACLDAVHGAGIDIGDGNNTITIDRCYAYNNLLGGFRLYAPSSVRSTNCTVRNSIAHNNGTGINNGGEIMLGASSNVTNQTMQDFACYNNLLINSQGGHGVSRAGGWTQNSYGLVANNLIVVTGGGRQVSLTDPNSTGIQLSSNIYAGASFTGVFNNVTYSTFAAWKAAIEGDAGQDTTYTLPAAPLNLSFYDAAALAGRYYTLSASPANVSGLDLNAAYGIATPTFDGFGQPFSFAAVGAGRGISSGGSVITTPVNLSKPGAWTTLLGTGGTVTISKLGGYGFVTANGSARSGVRIPLATVNGQTYTVRYTLSGAIDVQVGSTLGGAELLAASGKTAGAGSITFTATGTTSYIQFSKITTGQVRVSNVFVN